MINMQKCIPYSDFARKRSHLWPKWCLYKDGAWGLGKVAQWGKNAFSASISDWVQVPRTQRMPMVVYTCNPSVPIATWEVETRESPGLPRVVSLMYAAVNKSPTSNKVRSEVLLWLLLTSISHSCPYSHTHRHTLARMKGYSLTSNKGGNRLYTEHL